MSEPSDWVAAIDAVATMSDLGRELRRRRIAAGFDTLPELVRSTKSGGSLARSTAYTVEEGKQRSSWISVKAYLRACTVKAPEIELWHMAHGRALLNYGTPGEPVTIPTAKQLAEMGSEEAARILVEIDTEAAADLLRRIDLKHAAQLVPEIHLSVILDLLVEVGQTRVARIFEKIDVGRGAELLCEMKTDEVLTILDQVGTRRAAELMGVMPCGRAAGILRYVTEDQAVRLLAAIGGQSATALIVELDTGILERLLDSSGVQIIAGILDWMDSETAGVLLAGRVSDERALDIMARMNTAPLTRLLDRAGVELAMRLVSRMSPTRTAEIFGSLHRDVQMELLTRSLSLQRAREVLLGWIDCTSPDEILFVVWMVEDMPMVRLAEIICDMEMSDAILFLAIVNGALRRRILAEIPMEEATLFKRELTSAGIASHLSRIPSSRANRYFNNLQTSSRAVLSKIEPDAAIEILLHEQTFEYAADELKHMPPTRVALMLEVTDAWVAAHIVVHLPIDEAEKVISAMNSEFAADILSRVWQNIDFRSYSQQDLSTEDWDQAKSRRQEFAKRLEVALGQSG